MVICDYVLKKIQFCLRNPIARLINIRNPPYRKKMKTVKIFFVREETVMKDENNKESKEKSNVTAIPVNIFVMQ